MQDSASDPSRRFAGLLFITGSEAGNPGSRSENREAGRPSPVAIEVTRLISIFNFRICRNPAHVGCHIFNAYPQSFFSPSSARLQPET